MTVTQTRPAPLTEDEERLIAKLITNPRVPSRDVARLQLDDLEVVRRTLFFVTRDLATQPPTLHPVIVVQPKQVQTLPANLEELERLVHDLYSKLEELKAIVPQILAGRIDTCLSNAVEAYGDTQRLLRWIDRAKDLIKLIESNPMFRSTTPPAVDLDALKARDAKLSTTPKKPRFKKGKKQK